MSDKKDYVNFPGAKCLRCKDLRMVTTGTQRPRGRAVALLHASLALCGREGEVMQGTVARRATRTGNAAISGVVLRGV